MKSLYIHIPFCKQKCLYCDFNSYSGKENLIDKYCEALKKELQSYSFHEFETIYFGGGTPSIIPAENIKEILEQVKCNGEITLELNPGTITREKLKMYRNAGVNRLSIGLQSTQDSILKEIGRIHTLKEFELAYEMARQEGFENINVDLMFGLPNQTLKDVKESVEYLIDINPEHISCYSLILHSPIFKNLPSEDVEREMYYLIQESLKKAGYEQYEISNFCRKGKESKHNLCYWNQKEYVGIGAGASSYLDNKRYINESSIELYIEKVNNNIVVNSKDEFVVNSSFEDCEKKNNGNENLYTIEEIQDEEMKIREYMILKLRLLEGVNCREFYEKFNVDILEKFKNEIKKLQSQELIEIAESENKSEEQDKNGKDKEKNKGNKNEKERWIRLTKKGLDFANIVWEEFI